MSRLRRPFLYDRYLFVTVKLWPRRAVLQEQDYKGLALSLARMRRKHAFALTAWVFLPDHGHAMIYPPYPLSSSRVIKAVKTSSMLSINLARRTEGELWQGRFFDRALRTVKEYAETVEYIHLNPVRRGRVRGAESWTWSSAREYAGMSAEEQGRWCGLTIDRVRLPADENTVI